jgi:hypothetical protein
MNLMIACLLVWVSVGLFARGFGRRAQLVVNGVAALMTLLYFLFPLRFI